MGLGDPCESEVVETLAQGLGDLDMEPNLRLRGAGAWVHGGGPLDGTAWSP